MPIVRSTRAGRKKDPDNENQDKEKGPTTKTASSSVRGNKFGGQLKERNTNSRDNKATSGKTVNHKAKKMVTGLEDNTNHPIDDSSKQNEEERQEQTTVDNKNIDMLPPAIAVDVRAEEDELSPPKKQKMNEDEGEENQEPYMEDDENKPQAEVVEGIKDMPSSTNSGSKNPSFSLKSHGNKTNNREEEVEEEAIGNNNMPEQLLTVISNLYLNVGERLRLNFLPRCLDDLAYCHRHHYHSDLPEAPISSQAHSLRSALQQYRYVSFINSTTDMVHRGEFPGKGIFTKIIELVLVSSHTYIHLPLNSVMFLRPSRASTIAPSNRISQHSNSPTTKL